MLELAVLRRARARAHAAAHGARPDDHRERRSARGARRSTSQSRSATPRWRRCCSRTTPTPTSPARGATPLALAAARGDDALAVCSPAGARVNAREHGTRAGCGATSLHAAVAGGTRTVARLLERGAEIAIPNDGLDARARAPARRRRRHRDCTHAARAAARASRRSRRPPRARRRGRRDRALVRRPPRRRRGRRRERRRRGRFVRRYERHAARDGARWRPRCASTARPWPDGRVRVAAAAGAAGGRARGRAQPGAGRVVRLVDGDGAPARRLEDALDAHARGGARCGHARRGSCGRARPGRLRTRTTRPSRRDAARGGVGGGVGRGAGRGAGARHCRRRRGFRARRRRRDVRDVTPGSSGDRTVWRVARACSPLVWSPAASTSGGVGDSHAYYFECRSAWRRRRAAQLTPPTRGARTGRRPIAVGVALGSRGYDAPREAWRGARLLTLSRERCERTERRRARLFRAPRRRSRRNRRRRRRGRRRGGRRGARRGGGRAIVGVLVDIPTLRRCGADTRAWPMTRSRLSRGLDGEPRRRDAAPHGRRRRAGTPRALTQAGRVPRSLARGGAERWLLRALRVARPPGRGV